MKQSKCTKYLMLLLCVVSLSACSSLQVTDVNQSHSLIQSDLARPHATVYFIRPTTEHVAGFADNELDVELDGEDLISLGKAEYTLVYLKPRDVVVTLRNQTQVRGRWEVAEMAQSRQFSFKAGETYYILTRMFDGEFRGAHFTPESIGLVDAKVEARYLTPAGAARERPIPET